MKDYFSNLKKAFLEPIERVRKTPSFHIVGTNFKLAFANEVGAIGMGLLSSVISLVVVIIVLATSIPILWPMATEASGNITAMTGTDAGTETIQAFWPVVLLIVGIGVAVGLIVYALKEFGIMGKG